MLSYYYSLLSLIAKSYNFNDKTMIIEKISECKSYNDYLNSS